MIIRMWAILTFILQLSLPSFAISWKVIGACSAQAIEEGAVEIDLKKSVFDVTRFIFDKNAIPYEVDLNDFSSILSSPSGEAAVEILDKQTARFYHWCNMVNGSLTYNSPSQVLFSKQSDVLIWFFGYTEYVGHQITKECAPAFKVAMGNRFCSK